MALPDFIKNLKKPGTELKETHIDYVLIGRKYAYKIKKPVHFAFVDFRTLNKRRHFCEEEVRLNRRYSPSVYLGVKPLRKDGKIVEYAVKMRSFRQSERLAQLLKQNKVTPRMIKEIADEIWDFHRKARIKGHTNSHQIWQDYKGDYSEIRKFIGQSLDESLYRHLICYLKRYLKEHKRLFCHRPIKDLHGDLHSENIFYHKRPYILDCIEFNRNFRRIDNAAEVAFFLMDLEYKGKPKLAKIFLHRYLEKSQDWGIIKLLNFYKCHYACVRGMVASLSHDKKTAKKYFLLARQYTQMKRPLIAVGGMIGAGKSTLAKQLSRQLNLPLIQSDQVRKALAGVEPFSRLAQAYYNISFTKKTYEAMFLKAHKLLVNNQGAILDASFSKCALRKGLGKLARETRTALLFIEVAAPTPVLLKRLKERKKDISDAGPQLLKSFKEHYQSPDELLLIKIKGQDKNRR